MSVYVDYTTDLVSDQGENADARHRQGFCRHRYQANLCSHISEPQVFSENSIAMPELFCRNFV